MSKVIAIANQKGGVGKTAVASNLNVGLAMNGKKVMVIDSDPQGNLTSSLGIDNVDELENARTRCLPSRVLVEGFAPARVYDIIPR